MQPSSPDRDIEFQSDIHRLRGVAILLIVATHCVTFFSWNRHQTAFDLAHDLFDNSTLIFMFISGYLFHHTSARFQYGRYLKNKLRNVLAPYLIAAAPGILYVLLYDGAKLNALGLDGYPSAEKAGYLLVYGGAQLNYALWFVPVMCLYYLVSPILLRAFERPNGYSWLLLLIPLSVLMHRPSYSHGHNIALALYFLSAYAIGMLCSKYHDKVVGVLDRRMPILVAASILVIVTHLFLSAHHGNYSVVSLGAFDHRDGWIDWLFIQKILVTFTLWAVLRRLSALRLRALDTLASASFTIYFLHLYVLFIAASAAHSAGVEISVVSFCALLALGVTLPVALAAMVRRLAPRWSRTLVGS
jgi:surface polysaccharide O-acyltransferase-like enzyme